MDFNTIYEALRNEKKNVDLAQLPVDFLCELEKYSSTLEGDVKDSFKRIVKDIFDRRERKLVSMAVNKSKAPESIIDYGVFSDDERKLFDELLSRLQDNRVDFFSKLGFDEKKPVKVEKKETKLVAKEDIPQSMGPDMKFYGPFSKGDEIIAPEGLKQTFLNKKIVEYVD